MLTRVGRGETELPRHPGGAGRRVPTLVRTTLILVVALGVLAAGAVVAIRTGVISMRPADDGPLAVDPADPHRGETGKTDDADERAGADDAPNHEPFGPPVLPALEDPGKLPDESGIAKAISRYTGDDLLGKHHGVSVRDVRTGKLLYSSNGGGSYIPASTTKLLTAAAVLDAYGPEHRFATTVELDARSLSAQGADTSKSGKPGESGSAKPTKPDPSRPATITLVGGGDPLLATSKAWKRKDYAVPDRRYPKPATVEQLAAKAAKQLTDRGIEKVRLDVDDTLFTEDIAPSWESQYVPTGVVSRIHALWVNSGRLDWPYSMPRSTDPALGAAEEFAAALTDAGVRVTDIRRGKAPSGGAAERLAVVHSAPVSELVTHTLLLSDNDTAEVLARQVAVARGEPATFAGAGTAILDQLTEVGLDTDGVRLYDGSGLSRDNRIPPNTLTELLAISARADQPRLRGVLTGLPVGGFSGSLSDRFVTTGGSVGVGGEGAGQVRAKTGTLNQVASLAGVIDTADGGLLAFDIVSDRGAPIDPRLGIDRAVAALTGCGCR